MKKLYAIAPLYVDDFRNLEARQEEFLSVDASSWDFTDEDQEENRPYEVVNGVAIYSIKGKMLAEGNFFTRIFGIPTYAEIGEVLSAMYLDEEVESVLMSISTPGGQIAGISDLSSAWRKLNAEKPVTVHTAGMLASAGVWLASNSSKIYASETAEVGSIGVLQMHVSQEEALKKEGIKVTVIKSAPLKALGSPAKNLTAGEEAHLQGKVDEAAELFKRQLYRTRYDIQEAAFTGEMFIASQASDVGLIDGVKTYSDVFNELVSASMGEAENYNGEGGSFTMKKKVTAEMYESAVAAGADPDGMEIISQADYDALSAAAEGTEPAEGAEGIEVIKDAEETEAAEGAEETEAAEGVEGTETTEEDEPEMVEASVHAEVLSQLAEAQEKAANLEAQVETLTADSNTIETMRGFLVERMATMRVALGLQKVDMSEFSASMIMTEYQAINQAFNKSFKIGGIVSPSAEEPKDVEAPKLTTGQKARYGAVGL